MAESTTARFEFPPLPGSGLRPEWTGRGFRVGGETVPIVSYEPGRSNWSDDLTAFHERTAGSAHFIDVASRRLAVEHARLWSGDHAPVILEIGSSSGFLLGDLRSAFPRATVIGSDVVPGSLNALARRQPDLPLLHFDLTRCPLPDASVDVAILLNVLEHIEDDGTAVRQLYRILRPGGLAVVEVPAGPELFDLYDELLLHHRRYRLPGLVTLFQQARFDVIQSSHLGCFVYPGFYAVKRLRRRRKAADATPAEIEAIVRSDIAQTAGNPLLAALTRLELWLGRKGIRWPFGIRCLLTARKPAAP
jgi:SAM-dependent methyltransferase